MKNKKYAKKIIKVGKFSNSIIIPAKILKDNKIDNNTVLLVYSDGDKIIIEKS